MFVTFGVTFAELRGQSSGTNPALPLTSAAPAAQRRPSPGDKTAPQRVELPMELWQQVVAPLALEDALRLRTANGWCFDLVAHSHRGALAARVANVSLRPWRQPPPGQATLERLLASEPAVDLALNDRHLQRAVERRLEKRRRLDPSSYKRKVSAQIFARTQAVLAAAHSARRVRLCDSLPFVRGVAAAPLSLPPNTDALQLNRLFSNVFPGSNDVGRLPAFLAANADRPVRHLQLSHSLGFTLGHFDDVRPLFRWRLTSLTLWAVPLEDDAFACLLRGDFSQLSSLTLASDPQFAHLEFEEANGLRGHQLKALCALPWPRLEQLELTGNFADADLSALATRAWPMLTSLTLGSTRLTNRSAHTLATLDAARLAHLEVRGGLDLGALAALMRPHHIAYASLALMQLRPTPSPRNVVRATVPQHFEVLDTPVRSLWVGQAEALQPEQVASFTAALLPFGRRLQRFELHTCVATHTERTLRLFDAAFDRLAPDTEAILTHCVDAAPEPTSRDH